MRIGIVAALAREAAAFADSAPRLFGEHPAVIVHSGPGPACAAAAVTALAALGSELVLSFGLAGGLAPGLGPGALVVARAVRDGDDELAADAALAARLAATLGAVQGIIAAHPVPVARAADKRALAAASGALTVDMESGAVARAARAHGLGFAALRCVVDGVGVDLPRAALAGMGADGGNDVLATLGALLRAPWELPALLALARNYGRATRALDAAARRLVATEPRR